MPTFSAIELENLLEPRVRDSYKKPLNLSPPPPRQQHPRHIYISPALYATPVPAPIPETATEPSSPSPYVVNHKRRGGSGSGSGAFGNRRSDADGFEIPVGEQGADSVAVAREVAQDDFSCGDEDEPFVHEDVEEEAKEKEEDGCVDTRFDSASVESEKEEAGDWQYDCRSFVPTTYGEFFDAADDFGSDSSLSNTAMHGQNLDSELRSLRLSLLEEIEKCKEAEDGLKSLRVGWQRIRDQLSEVGIRLPSFPESSDGFQLKDASVEDLSQQLNACRDVAHTLGKAEGRAEAELAAETILQSKDLEISRLRDRLQYYEAVNREMCQRNQEIVDVARKQRQRRKKRWFWSLIGASAAVGISVVAAAAYTSRHEDVSIPSNSDTSSSLSD